MEVIGPLIIFLIVGLIFWVLLSLPTWIGKSRGISHANLSTVRLLAILGLFFGVTWIVALVLACVYPPEIRTTKYNMDSSKGNPKKNDKFNYLTGKTMTVDGSKGNSKQYDPIPETYNPATESLQKDSDSESEPVAVADAEKCENCNRKIGKLEVPMIWQDHVVCKNCYNLLKTQ